MIKLKNENDVDFGLNFYYLALPNYEIWIGSLPPYCGYGFGEKFL
jgi:hypothetical protein